jgi:hypothetical protein
MKKLFFRTKENKKYCLLRQIFQPVHYPALLRWRFGEFVFEITCFYLLSIAFCCKMVYIVTVNQ